MNTAHHARIFWVPSTQRNHFALPTLLRYVALSRFPEDGPQWPDGAWSVVLQFMQPPAEAIEPVVSDAMVSFWVEEAPHERLHPGAQFSIYVGLTKMADVEIVGLTVPTGWELNEST